VNLISRHVSISGQSLRRAVRHRAVRLHEHRQHAAFQFRERLHVGDATRLANDAALPAGHIGPGACLARDPSPVWVAGSECRPARCTGRKVRGGVAFFCLRRRLAPVCRRKGWGPWKAPGGRRLVWAVVGPPSVTLHALGGPVWRLADQERISAVCRSAAYAPENPDAEMAEVVLTSSPCACSCPSPGRASRAWPAA
jgi:hypothetical protein